MGSRATCNECGRSLGVARAYESARREEGEAKRILRETCKNGAACALKRELEKALADVR